MTAGRCPRPVTHQGNTLRTSADTVDVMLTNAPNVVNTFRGLLTSSMPRARSQPPPGGGGGMNRRRFFFLHCGLEQLRSRPLAALRHRSR
jgi:hypothetical protein